MPKLSQKGRAVAIYELETRLIKAIEETPKGITDGEIRQAILKVSRDLHISPKMEIVTMSPFYGPHGLREKRILR